MRLIGKYQTTYEPIKSQHFRIQTAHCHSHMVPEQLDISFIGHLGEFKKTLLVANKN